MPCDLFALRDALLQSSLAQAGGGAARKASFPVNRSRRLRVRVGANLWLRRTLDPFIQGHYSGLIGRRLGVGQGPMEFMNRLLAHRGDSITFVPTLRFADVGLFVGVPAEEELEMAERYGVRIVLRLDGIGLDSPRIQEDRERLRAVREQTCVALNRAHGVIFQSEFARRAFCEVFGAPRCYVQVIPNGFLPATRKVGSAGAGSVQSDKTLVVAGRNVLRKRMWQTVARFCQSPFTREYRLEVASPIDPDEDIRHPSVTLLGALPPAHLQRRLMTSRGLLHLDWYDWCPNLVGEAITARTPVLCGSLGGTPELVRTSGVIHDFHDPMPNFRHGVSVPPEISQEQFNVAVGKFLATHTSKLEMDRPDLDISTVARRYTAFLHEVMAISR